MGLVYSALHMTPIYKASINWGPTYRVPRTGLSSGSGSDGEGNDVENTIVQVRHEEHDIDEEALSKAKSSCIVIKGAVEKYVQMSF